MLTGLDQKKKTHLTLSIPGSSKLQHLKFFVSKNTFSTVDQLKTATVAINSVLTELKNISPDNFLQ